jgi:hypothetical protein
MNSPKYLEIRDKRPCQNPVIQEYKKARTIINKKSGHCPKATSLYRVFIIHMNKVVQVICNTQHANGESGKSIAKAIEKRSVFKKNDQ